MQPNRKMGAGWASQILAQHANSLERREERPRVVEAIRVVLAQRSKLLTEKYGPPRDFSGPMTSVAPKEHVAAQVSQPFRDEPNSLKGSTK